MFFYIAQKRKQGDNRSSSILTQEWKGLPPNTHEWWMAKYRTHLSIKRNQESDAKAFAAEQDPGGPSMSTSWGVGNADFPIHPDSFRAFLRKYQGKRAALEALQTVVDTSNPRPAEIEEYIEEVSTGKKPYHIKTALGLMCNHALGPALDGDAIRECQLAREIMATHKLPNGCFSDHAGLCLTVHAEELNTTKYYPVLQRTTQYYNVLLQYFSVLQSTTPVLLCTTKYYASTTLYYSSTMPVLQSTTPVLLCTTKYYASTTLYYKVLLQYYSATTLYYNILLQYYKVLLQNFASTTTYYATTFPLKFLLSYNLPGLLS